MHLRVTQKALQLPLYFFLLFLSVGVSEMDWLKLFCEYFNIRYPGGVWPRSDLFPWTHWEIFVWWSVHCYIKVFHSVNLTLFTKKSKNSLKFVNKMKGGRRFKHQKKVISNKSYNVLNVCTKSRCIKSYGRIIKWSILRNSTRTCFKMFMIIDKKSVKGNLTKWIK